MAPPPRVAPADACPAVTRVAGRLGHHFTCVAAYASLHREWSRWSFLFLCPDLIDP